MTEFLFWAVFALLAYSILGYPVLLLLFARMFGRDARTEGVSPRSFSFLIAAYNEEACIREKVLNCLSLADAGAYDVEVIVVSDGSSDRTEDEVRAIVDPRVRLVIPEGRRGKALALNHILPMATKEIFIFTDANSIVAPGALEAMAHCFADPAIGGVCGEIAVESAGSRSIARGEGFYWKYDQAMKRAETRLGGAVSAQGSFYAIRACHAAPFRPDCADDFYNSVRVVAMGGRLAFERGVRATEHVTELARKEMGRRIRSTERGWRALMAHRALMNPLKHGWYAWQLLSHKFLRRLTPFFLFALLPLNLALTGTGPIYLVIAALQVLTYAIIAGAAMSGRFRALPVVRQLFFFAMSNLAMALGLIRYMRGQKSTLWNPVREQGS